MDKSGDQRPLATKRRAKDDQPTQTKFPVRCVKQPNIALEKLFSENDEPCTSSSILAGNKPDPSEQKPFINLKKQAAPLANHNSAMDSKLKDDQQRQEVEQRRKLPLSSSSNLVGNKPVLRLKPLVRLEKVAAPLANHNSNSVVRKDSSEDSKLKDEQQRHQEVDQRRVLPLAWSCILAGNKPMPRLKPLVRMEILEALSANHSSNSVVWRDSSEDSKLKDEQQRHQAVDQRRELPLSEAHEERDETEQHNRENLGHKKVRSFQNKLFYYIQKVQNHQDRYFALMGGPLDEVIVTKFGLQIHRRDLFTLNDKKWLNDAVINFYLNLIQERSEQRGSTELASVYTFSTFFMVRLLGHGQAGVKKWTKNVDIFAKDIILVPVNSGGVIWSIVIIDMRNKSVGYYTSSKHPHQKMLDALEVYLREESLDKRQLVLDTSAFRIETVANVPQQDNKSDSGVFSCMFAEYITRDVPITFAQEHIEYYRKRMVLEIADGKLWR